MTTTKMAMRGLDRVLRHSLNYELFHLTSSEATVSLEEIRDLGLRHALQARRRKEVEAIQAALEPATTPDDKYSTLFWIKGPKQEKLRLTTGIVEPDHYTNYPTSTYHFWNQG